MNIASLTGNNLFSYSPHSLTEIGLYSRENMTESSTSATETKKKLLESAKKEFLEKGFMGASLRTIAANAVSRFTVADETARPAATGLVTTSNADN